ncbi:MAG: universal stress protein [Sulfitobacter sp.]
MFKTILLAFDGSDHAQNALVIAAGLAKAHDAALHVVHCPQVDTPPIVIGSYVSLLETPPTPQQIAEAAQHIADKAAAEAKAEGVELAKVHLGTGAPAAFVLSTAEQLNADLIVLGRRGLGSLGALALGSVSQAVSHGAKCACLTVV